MLGFDCASIVKPEWAPQLRALGYDFFCRYFRRTLVSRYAISPEEAAPDREFVSNDQATL